MKKKKVKKVIHNMMPSLGARMRLIETGKRKYKIIGDTPIDRPDCECHGLIKEYKNRAGEGLKMGYIECPRVKRGNYPQRQIRCKHCREVLATFNGKNRSLDEDYYNLHYHCWHDSKSWYGCTNVNVNPVTLKVNFECTCGNKVIEDENLKQKDKRRFTEYEIF